LARASIPEGGRASDSARAEADAFFLAAVYRLAPRKGGDR
jgi:hypothetical protein